MTALQVLVDVADARKPGFRRLTALTPNNRQLVVCSAREGSENGDAELRFDLDQANQLARAALAGDARALTTPGLARTLAATVAVLFRVCVSTGALINVDEEDFDGGTGHFDDREAAADVADLDS
jgi:hypothetical protein